jgi:hypothetical protein
MSEITHKTLMLKLKKKAGQVPGMNDFVIKNKKAFPKYIP